MCAEVWNIRLSLIRFKLNGNRSKLTTKAETSPSPLWGGMGVGVAAKH